MRRWLIRLIREALPAPVARTTDQPIWTAPDWTDEHASNLSRFLATHTGQVLMARLRVMGMNLAANACLDGVPHRCGIAEGWRQVADKIAADARFRHVEEDEFPVVNRLQAVQNGQSAHGEPGLAERLTP